MSQTTPRTMSAVRALAAIGIFGAVMGLWVTSAQATKFDFSYLFGSGEIFSGMIEGVL